MTRKKKFAPQSNLSEFPSAMPELTGDNVTAMDNISAGQLLDENEIDSGEINASAPEETQMDTNGDGIVDETESQNQPAVTKVLPAAIRCFLVLNIFPLW